MAIGQAYQGFAFRLYAARNAQREVGVLFDKIHHDFLLTDFVMEPICS
jgi:hypothetical protein